MYYNDMWHVYATTANAQGNWSIVYLSFKDWSEAANAKPYYIDQNPGLRGYHCAPQVFYFRPHKKWYLIYQSQHPQYSTTDDLSKPETWTRARELLRRQAAGDAAAADRLLGHLRRHACLSVLHRRQRPAVSQPHDDRGFPQRDERPRDRSSRKLAKRCSKAA